MRQAATSWVSSNYFTTLGIPIVSGRALREDDPACGRAVCSVVVSQQLAREFWPDENPLGQTLQDRQNNSFEVVGVARDISSQRPRRPDDPTIYTPWVPQSPPGYHHALLRFTGDDAALASAIISAARALSPELKVDPKTIQARIDEPMDSFKKLGTLVVLLGAIAVGLATLGIYGVVSFDVSRRTKEMGVRIALGARRRDIYWAVLGASGRPVALGLLVGLTLALAGASALDRGLAKRFAMNTYDPLAFAAAVALLVAVALAAMLRPARRATRVDPMVALRCE